MNEERPTIQKTGGGWYVSSWRPGHSRSFNRQKDAQIYYQQESQAWDQRNSRHCITCGAAIPADSPFDWCDDSETCIPQI
jgi:hypothetical protein